jgi:arylsulfatase A-like enzyme
MKPPTTPPNLLIFMTDHQRADTLQPWGRAQTPNLDRLARDGLTFTSAFCPAPHCCPARATFMTGLYPSRHGVWNNICNDWALARGLKPGVRCWSEDLRDAGYRLGYAGKWHVSVEEGPAQRGFAHLGRVTGNKINEHGQAWAHYDRVAAQPRPAARAEGQLLRPGWGDVQLYGSWTHGAERVTHDEKVADDGVALVRELAAGRGPWGLFLGAIMPHDTYQVPTRYLDRYRLEDIPLPPSYGDDMAGKPAIVRRIRRDLWGQLSEREVREAIRHYLAMCTWLDELFGEVLAALDASGQAENTLVLYCADHGDYMGDHGLFAKGIPCYRGAYHVPAVLRWPAGIRCPGRQEDAFVSLADFAPTFQELAGRAPDVGLTGRSLVPFLRGEAPAAWRDELHTQCDGVELYYTQRSVTTREFKYVLNGFDDDEFYDLRSDPHELVNQARNPAYAETVRDLLGRIWRFARREQDKVPNSYLTVALAPCGPGLAAP